MATGQEETTMPTRKSTSPKTYALSLNPSLVCKRVQVKDCASLAGSVDAFQVFDGERKIGRHGRNSADAWSNAYNKLSAQTNL
jgi:hypothetical protein